MLASVELPFDDPDLAGMTVADVLDDPARFVGETLADPIEGVEDGRCKAKVMWDGVGLPFIHSLRARSRRLPAALRRRSGAGAHCPRRGQRCGRRTGQAGRHGRPQRGRDRPRWSHDVAKRAGVGVRDVKSTLKAGWLRNRRNRTAAARERRLAERSDPRPLQDRPALDAEWLPVIGALDEVASAVERVRRPRRDIDGTLTRERRMPIAQTHAFTTANDEGDDA